MSSSLSPAPNVTSSMETVQVQVRVRVQVQVQVQVVAQATMPTRISIKILRCPTCRV